MSDWSLYILRTCDDRLYTGISTDVARRFAEHSSGSVKAAKAVRHRQPLSLCYQVQLGPRSLALRAEHRLKQLPRPQKLALISQQPDRAALLQWLQLDPSLEP